MTDEPAGKRRRGRPKGSYKKPQREKVYQRMSPRDKAFLQEARDGDLYPVREHEVVNRVCAAIETETGIIVEGEAKLFLYALYQTCVSWTIDDCGLAGLYGLPSARAPGVAKGKRRSEVFEYLKCSFEEASGCRAPHSCGENGCLFARFARIAILGLMLPRLWRPHFFEKLQDDPVNHAFLKAIENAGSALKEKYDHGLALAPIVKLTVKFPPPYAASATVTVASAMPYHEVPAFVRSLRGQKGMAARALEFLILTAARPGEAIGARWLEIDLAAKVWTVPPSRMKSGREHRVPLSGQAAAILENLASHETGDFIFPGNAHAKPLANMAFEMLLRRMKIEGAATHGFRSSFWDWAADKTTYPREIVEAALAQVAGDATEQAYRRGDALEKRHMLMESWAAFCAPGGGGAAMTGEPAGKRRRRRPKGSHKKTQLEKVREGMPPRDKAFLQEAREGDLYPAREHKVVNRVCAAIETLTVRFTDTN